VITSYYHAPTVFEGSDPMRGSDEQAGYLFSYISAEARVPADHPLRPLRAVVDGALRRLSPRFEKLYVRFGRPSIAPEKLLRALLLQVLYTIRSERQLVEQLQYNLLFQWFVGLSLDDAVWDATTLSKNRDRLLNGDIATAFSTKSSRRRARKGCCRRSISRWTVRCSRRGRVRRVYGRATRMDRIRRPAGIRM
jgi:transposase